MAIRISTGTGGGIVGKIIFSAFGLFFAFMGSMFVKQEWNSLQETKAMQEWVQTPCTITGSKTEDAGEDFRLRLTYRYTVDGISHKGSRYGKQKHYTAESIGDIKAAQKKYPRGKTVDGHYNPANPPEAVLKLPTVKGARNGLLFALVFPAVGLLFAAVPWLRGGKNKKGANKKELSPKLFLIPFGSIFAAVGLLMIKPFLIEPLQKIQEAKTWNEVPATVVSSKVKSHSSDDGTTYSPYIAYRYKIDSTEYFGDQYTFMGGSSSGYDGKAAIVRQYPKKHKFTIYVNPANPAESVINRDPSLSLLFGLIPLIFTTIGIVIIIFGFRAKTSKAKLDPKQANEHVVTLKGKSPIAKAVGVTLFACIWDGIVFLLFNSDAPMLFPIVFGLFGIAITVGAVIAILAIFNPRPTVEITPGKILPGTNVALRWRIGGSAERIRELKVTLKCLKVTTETRRSGGESRTSTVKTPLHEEELFLSSKQRNIAQNAIQFTIPAGQPASRPGNHNGIEWQLLFHGDIARWPDMKEELPFLVYPEQP